MSRLVCTHESYNCIKNKFAKQISRIKYIFRSCERRKSYYHALGLESTATAKDIKSAYYKLSLQFHPDKNNGSEESVTKFREITEAYEILSNPEKKRKYDQNYCFQHNYNPKYSQTGKFYRSSSYKGPFTGRTKDFNYDEHYKQHYQDYQRQREVENEYFKRRWEADFHRRYPNPEDYYRNRHEKTTPEELSRRITSRKRSYYVIFSVWITLIFITIYQAFSDPDNSQVHSGRNGPLYYKVSRDNNKSDNDHE